MLEVDYKFEKVFEDEELFPKGRPDPSDISQGLIRRCWLLSTLSSLAVSNPSAIERRFIDKRENKDYVKIRLYKIVRK